MIWAIIYFFLALFSRIVVSDSVPILIENETAGIIERLGDLVYNDTVSEFFLDKKHINIDAKQIQIKDFNGGDRICVGYESDDKLFNCFSYKEFIPGACMKFSIYQRNDGSAISYNFGFQKCNDKKLVDTKISKPVQGKMPDLVKMNDEKRKMGPRPESKRNDNVKTKNQQQSEGDVTQENFFQKYWMFLVPLGIMMIFSGSSNKSE